MYQRMINDNKEREMMKDRTKIDRKKQNSVVLKKQEVDDIILRKDRAVIYNNYNERLKKLDENLERIKKSMKKNTTNIQRNRSLEENNDNSRYERYSKHYSRQSKMD